jgi:hypothetical protein
MRRIVTFILLSTAPVFSQEDAHIIRSADEAAPAPLSGESMKPPMALVTERTYFRMDSGRWLTFNRVARPSLPLTSAATSSAIADPALTDDNGEAALTSQGDRGAENLHVISASVPSEPNEEMSRATLVRWWHEGKEFAAWSNVDFRYLNGFSGFKARGSTYHMILGVCSVNPETYRVPPGLPSLEEAGAVYALVKGDETNEGALDVMEALHELYDAEEDYLIDAYRLREETRLSKDAEPEVSPPKPQDRVIYYWRSKK